MESIKNNCLLVIGLLCFSFGNAQSTEFNSDLTPLKKVDKETIYFQDSGLDKAQLNNKFSLNQNIVQISQMGNSHSIDLNIASSNSKMSIDQNGFNNHLEVYKNAKQLNQTIVQNGKNNFISDVSSYYEKAINMAINQEGNNLVLFNNGTNSISKDLIISQKGNSGSVYIFNH